mgnify:CR=1 FL=1
METTLKQDDLLISQFLKNCNGDLTKLFFYEPSTGIYHKYLMTIHFYTRKGLMGYYKENKVVPNLSFEHESFILDFCDKIVEPIAFSPDPLSGIISYTDNDFLTRHDDGNYYFLGQSDDLHFILCIPNNSLVNKQKNFYMYLYQ